MSTTSALTRFVHVGALLLPGVFASAQCGPYKFHPLWPETVGWAYLNEFECGPADNVIWDNGATTWQVNGLAPGLHWVDQYLGGQYLSTDTFEIEQLYWDLQQIVLVAFPGVEVDVYASVPYCGTSIFNHPTCSPPADSVVIFLLQDGVLIDSITPVDCTYTFDFWGGLPTGHTYQCVLEDRSNCASSGEAPVTTVHTCDSMAFITNVIAASGGLSNGSIDVLGMLPDTLSDLPLPPPFTGTFTLLALPNYDLIGTVTGSTASWTGLPAGDYLIGFMPDSLCSAPSTVVTIGNSTGMVALSGADPLFVPLWPNPTVDQLHWNGTTSLSARVLDVNGREVLQASGKSPLDVSRLPAGVYLLDLGHARRGVFLKE